MCAPAELCCVLLGLGGCLLHQVIQGDKVCSQRGTWGFILFRMDPFLSKRNPTSAPPPASWAPVNTIVVGSVFDNSRLSDHLPVKGCSMANGKTHGEARHTVGPQTPQLRGICLR